MEIKVKTKTGQILRFQVPCSLQSLSPDEILKRFKEIHKASIKVEEWEIIEPKQ